MKLTRPPRKVYSVSTKQRPLFKYFFIALVVAGVAVISMEVIVGLSRESAHPESTSSVSKPQPKSVARTASASTPEQCLANLPLNFLVGQTLMVGIESDELTRQASLFKQYNIGGGLLMSAPANPSGSSIEQFKNSAASLGVPVLISTDEEGGGVQRFSVLGTLPSPEQAAVTMSPAQIQNLVATHGEKLKAIGIDMILGPLADVAPAQGSAVLGDRIFSSNPQTVSTYALAYVNGWEAAGLLPTLKHFPGMGSASGNTDNESATTPPLSYLQQHDFLPYEGSINSTGTAVMVGNQTVPNWSNGPASLSPTVDAYLRGVLGYKNNLLITDSLNAVAVTNVMPEAQAVVAAIKAGNDIALFVEPSSTNLTTDQNLFAQMETNLENAVNNGTIPKSQLLTSVARKLSAEHVSACSLSS